MRLLVLGLTLAMTAQPADADAFDTDWQLLAIDGVASSARATLRFDKDGRFSGRAPCNSWSVVNQDQLPVLSLKAIRATRMACDRQVEEQAFFDTLEQMTLVETASDGSNLILSAPDGRSMEFVREPANSLTVCQTCPPAE
jgi:heat shock protein HslJ